MKALIDKTASFVRRIRWRAYFFLQRMKERDKRSKLNGSDSDSSEDEQTRETYVPSFKSSNYPTRAHQMNECHMNTIHAERKSAGCCHSSDERHTGNMVNACMSRNNC